MKKVTSLLSKIARREDLHIVALVSTLLYIIIRLLESL